jgi:hypothetical protein
MPDPKKPRRAMNQAIAEPIMSPTANETRYGMTLVDLLQQFAKAGMTLPEMAEALEITEPTLNRWIAELPAVKEALKKGREIADAKVAASLYRRAVGGFEQRETKIVRDAEGNLVGSTETVRVLPPDPGAISFWLKNRRPDLWRDKIEHDVTGKLSIEVTKRRRELIDQLLDAVLTDVTPGVAEKALAAADAIPAAEKGQ